MVLEIFTTKKIINDFNKLSFDQSTMEVKTSFTKEEVGEIFSEFSIKDEIIELKLIPAGWEVIISK
jgi:hypothetical protein